MNCKPKSKRNMALLLGGCAAIALPNLARADTTWDPSVANGSWNTPANWLGGVLPGAGDNATISFNDAADHTITYDGSYSSTTKTVTLTNLGGGDTNLTLSNNYSFSASGIQLGANGKASIQQSDGTITTNGALDMASTSAAGVATYNLSGGTLSALDLHVGLGLTENATFNQSGGTVLAGGDMELGGENGTAHYELTGGTLIVNGYEDVSDLTGSTQFVQSGGTHINTAIGQAEGLILDSFFFPPPTTPQPILYLLSGGTLITNSEDVGSTFNVFTQTGGVHKVGTPTIPGLIEGGYTVQGGELDIIGLQLGGNLQTGGTVNIGVEGGTFTSSLYLTDDLFGYSLAGGELNTIGSIFVGSNSPLGVTNARFTQSGGTNNLGTATSPGTLALADDYVMRGGDRGTYSLNGSSAVLNVIGSEYVGQGGMGTFLQSAGIQDLGTASSPSQLYVGHDSTAKGFYRLSGGTFLASGTEFVGYDGLGTFIVSSGGFHSLTGNMYLGGSDTLASATGKGTLTVSGTLNISGTLKLWNNATASYNGGSMNLGGLDVGGGLFKITAGKSRVLRTGSVSTSSGGKFDLNDNSIIVDYPDGGPSQESSIASQIQTGYANGAWNGPGITSSIAASDPTKRIGYADNASLGLSSFSGEPVDSSSVLVKLTYGGDANLDGVVNIADLEALAQNWNSSGDWLEGDFDYNGTVDVNDLKILALNWNAGDSLVAEEASLGLPIVVPEPFLPAFAILAFCTGLRSSRRRRV